jgi:signal transduction histidine kinase
MRVWPCKRQLVAWCTDVKFQVVSTLIKQTLLCLCLVVFTAWSLLVYSSGEGGPASNTIDLGPSEQAWLQDHPVIRLAPDPNFAPIEWFNQLGDYNGITSDYVALLQEQLGIRFEIVQGESWKDILEMARRGEVDALSAIIRTAPREHFLAFTEPYFVAKRALFSNRDLKTIGKLDDLQGYKIAVVEGSWMDETLGEKAGMSINRFQDLSTALQATSLGVTDVTGSSLDTMTFTRRKEGLTNLRQVGELPDQMRLSIAVRTELAPLVGILNKALAQITAEQAERIRARWIEVEEPGFWDNPLYRYSALGLALVLLSAMVLVLVWNRMLNARVQERGRQLYEARMQLIQAEKMETVGRLSAGVAHEVKNPLAIIQMGADYLVQVIPPENGVHEVIADINDAVRRADRVIKDLLDFSHSDELDMTPADLNALVEEAMRLVAHEYRKRNIDLHSQLLSTNPPVRIDANKIQQVLINMLMNAAQAVGRDGEVVLSCEVVSFERDSGEAMFAPGEPVLRLTISDNGPGISQENLDKLFDPFFTTKPVGEGTGLGLSVSKNIMELHSGRLAVGNGSSRGAVVTMDFKIEKGLTL